MVEWTRTSPKEVLGLLVKTGDFETAKTWAEMENLADDIKQVGYTLCPGGCSSFRGFTVFALISFFFKCVKSFLIQKQRNKMSFKNINLITI